MTTPARICALDLSLSATGIATPWFSGVVDPSKRRSKRRGMERLAYIRSEVMRWVLHPEQGWVSPYSFMAARLVVLENYSYGSHSSHAHELGELGGVIRMALYEAKIPVAEVAPASLKMFATGKGNAGKEEVLASAIRRLGYDGHDDNVADALWLLELARHVTGDQPGRVPDSHLRGLDKIAWPDIVTAGT